MLEVRYFIDFCAMKFDKDILIFWWDALSGTNLKEWIEEKYTRLTLQIEHGSTSQKLDETLTANSFDIIILPSAKSFWFWDRRRPVIETWFVPLFLQWFLQKLWNIQTHSHLWEEENQFTSLLQEKAPDTLIIILTATSFDSNIAPHEQLEVPKDREIIDKNNYKKPLAELLT